MALGCVALGAVAVLVAAGRPWAVVDLATAPGLPPLPEEVGAPGGVAALGLAGLAAIAALVATRGLARRAVGLLVLAAAAGVVAYAVASVRAPDGTGAFRAEPTAWPWVATVGALVLGSGGVLALVGGHRWPGLGRRDDPDVRGGTAPTGTAATDTASFWRALDRGDDPTV